MPGALQGKVAIANAKLTYHRYQALFSGARWDGLARRGAMTQRLLWASTGTKNKNYSDVLYVEELTGPETVTTIPPATFEAFRDHGRPESRLTLGVDEAKLTMLALEQAGVSMKEITDRLLEEGLKAFTDAFNNLLDAVQHHSKENTSDATP